MANYTPALEAFLLEKRHADVIEPANTKCAAQPNFFDLAIRGGEQRDSSFTQKKLANIAVCLVSRRDCKKGDRPLLCRTLRRKFRARLAKYRAAILQGFSVNDTLPWYANWPRQAWV
ncbi:hypothetical protein OH492_16945 [Vibrio chagasii]|nr:hypothetical protein [Vibrio chagasii]